MLVTSICSFSPQCFLKPSSIGSLKSGLCGKELKDEMDLKLPTVNPLDNKWVVNSLEKLRQNRKIIEHRWINAEIYVRKCE